MLTEAQAGGVPTVLLVDYRERVRAQLHNFFEAEGYNLLEAVDEQEALALGEMHQGSLDLLVAEELDADRISATLRETHPGLKVLKIVDTLCRLSSARTRSGVRSRRWLYWKKRRRF